MTDVRDLIANLTLAVIDLAGAVAQIAETMPEHTQAQINDSLNVAIAISAGDSDDSSVDAADDGPVAEAGIAAEAGSEA